MVQQNLLIVDDDAIQLRLLEHLLQRDDLRVLKASSGPEALSILKCMPVSVIISDYQMPEMSGVEFLKAAKEKAPHAVRIMLTGRTDAEGAIDAINVSEVFRYLTKPFDNEVLRATVEQALLRAEILQHTDVSTREEGHHEQQSGKLTSEDDEALHQLQETRLQAVMTLGQMIEFVGPNHYEHTLRVGRLAQMIGRKLNLSEHELTDLFYSALLHDLWKIGLRNNRDRQAQLRLGVRIIETLEFLRPAARILRYHCEHYDGSGWPDHLRENQIPLEAQILATADAYDNLQYDLDSRPHLSQKRAFELLLKSAGKEFDPRVVAALGEALSENQARPSTGV
jgi:response regulator RpfG family c-di-GMP phosphodiesterase